MEFSIKKFRIVQFEKGKNSISGKYKLGEKEIEKVEFERHASIHYKRHFSR